MHIVSLRKHLLLLEKHTIKNIDLFKLNLSKINEGAEVLKSDGLDFH